MQEAIAQAAPNALFSYSYTNLINVFATYVQQKDIAADAWYLNAISCGLKNDIIKSMSADTFSPDGNVPLEQMAIILSATAKTLGITVSPCIFIC